MTRGWKSISKRGTRETGGKAGEYGGPSGSEGNPWDGGGGAGIPEGAQREQVLGGRKRGLYLERESAWLVGEGRTWE